MIKETKMGCWKVENDYESPHGYYVTASSYSIKENYSKIQILCKDDDFRINFYTPNFQRSTNSVEKKIGVFENYVVNYSFNKQNYHKFHLESAGDDNLFFLSRANEIRNFFNLAQDELFLFLNFQDSNNEVHEIQYNITGILKIYNLILEYSHSLYTMKIYDNWNLYKLNYLASKNIASHITYNPNSNFKDINATLVYEIENSGEELFIITFSDLPTFNKLKFNYRKFSYTASFDNIKNRIMFKVDCFNNKLYFYSTVDNISIIKQLLIDSNEMSLILKDKNSNIMNFNFSLIGFKDAIEDINYEKHL